MATSKSADWLMEEGLAKLRQWQQQNLSTQEIASRIGIAPTTLLRWQRKYPALAAAMQKPSPAKGETPQAASSIQDEAASPVPTAKPAAEPNTLPQQTTASVSPIAFPGICDLNAPLETPTDEAMDLLVQNALLRRAVGFQYDEYTYASKTDPVTGETVLAPSKRTTKTVLPDISAQIYWLKNRLPSIWRDKPAEATTDQTVQVVFDTDEEADDE